MIIITKIILRNEQIRMESVEYFVLEEVTYQVDDTPSQRLLFISLEGLRRPLFYTRGFRRDPNAGNTLVAAGREDGSEDGLHYLALSMRGTTLAVQAT